MKAFFRSPCLQSKSVTIVDDEPYARDILIRAATMAGFSCQGFENAESAWRALERQTTPIVVTDLRMPGKGGLWLIREIQQRWPNLSIIVVSVGVEEDGHMETILNKGVSHYLLKPVHLDEFCHALESCWQTQNTHANQGRYEALLEGALIRQSRELRKTFHSAITSLVRTLEARDVHTSGHSLRVRNYSVALAKKIGLTPKALKALKLAAWLHDIGKMGLPEAILNKPTLLTDEEFSRVREHPVVGERILTPIIRNPLVLQAIRGHHERYDGRGYPDGISGENIPLLARIITVADCYDALTTTRAYRSAQARDSVLDFLRAGMGTQFDPDLVPPFVDVIESTSMVVAG